MSNTTSRRDRLKRRNNRASYQSLVVNAFVEGLVRDGELDLTGLEGEDLENAIAEGVLRAVSGKIEMVIDHTSDLLALARDHFSARDFSLSCLFFATWFEHFLNSLVLSTGRRKGISENDMVQVIRNVNFDGKTGWLLSLLGLPRLADLHRRRMVSIANLRNSFVHYKWRPEPDDRRTRDDIEQALVDVEKTIKYLKSYERKQFYPVGKSRIQTAIQARRKRVSSATLPN